MSSLSVFICVHPWLLLGRRQRQIPAEGDRRLPGKPRPAQTPPQLGQLLFEPCFIGDGPVALAGSLVALGGSLVALGWSSLALETLTQLLKTRETWAK